MKMIRKCFFYACCFVCFSSCYAEPKGEKIEALLLIDSQSNLNCSVRQDEKVMLKTLQKIAKKAKMSLKTTVYKNKEATYENIQKWIFSLQKTTHDVVLFYFSGHGCQEKTTLIPWPKLFFSSKYALFSMKAVINAIEATTTRLSIIVADCCNGPLANKSIGISLQAKGQTNLSTTALPQGAEKLFKMARGHIRATAASPGQSAYSFTCGSVFTLALSQALSDAMATINPSWEGVFKSTRSVCKPLQTPYISLELK